MSNKSFSVVKNSISGTDINFGGKDVVIFSHVDCFDGTVAAYIAAKNVCWKQCNSYHVIYGSYQKEKPLLPQQFDTPPIVLIVDYSFVNFEDVVTLAKECEHVVWLDHHGTAYTAIEDYDLSTIPDNLHIVLTSEYSGALLTSRFFDCSGVFDFLARHIDDHDRHQHVLGQCTPLICDLLAMYGVDNFDGVEKVINSFIIPYLKFRDHHHERKRILDEMHRQLEAYKSFIDTTVEYYVQNAFLATVHGEEFIATFGPRKLRGVINAGLMKAYQASTVAVLTIVDRKVRLSLRSNNGSAGRISEKWGGGGHGNAAGCDVMLYDINMQYIQ